MYNKLFGKIVDSSIWLAPDPVRIVWITFLAVMDEDGFVHLPTVANVSHRARVELTDAEEAIRVLESPEPSTATDEDDGRRIERVPGGWIVLNAKKYRDMATREIQRASTRARVQRHRDKKRAEAAGTAGNGSVTPEKRSVMQSEAEAYTDTEAKKNTTAAPRPTPPEFDQFKALFPKRAGSQPWPKALKAINARLTEGHTWTEIIDGARRYQEFCVTTGKGGTEYVMQAATFCGPDKRFLEPWTAPATKADNRQQANVDAFQEAERRIFGP